MLSPEELQQELGIGRNRAYQLCQDPDFYPAFKLGRIWKVCPDALQEWIQEQTRRETA